MFEHKKERVISRRHFAHRLLKSFLLALALCLASLAAGVVAYHQLEGLPWIDAFLNASMILGGMGPVDVMKTGAGKLFAGCYAIYSGFFMMVSMGILLSPVFHRIVHTFHFDSEQS